MSSLECFNCGKLFQRSESLAANTHELYAATYCSLECQDKDTESMNLAIKQAAEEQEAAKDLDLEQGTPVKIIEAGGFKLRVKG